MTTKLNALAIALALSARLVASQAHAADIYGSTTGHDPRTSVSTSGLYSPYNPADQYSGPNGFPLPGWSQLKEPFE